MSITKNQIHYRTKSFRCRIPNIANYAYLGREHWNTCLANRSGYQNPPLRNSTRIRIDLKCKIRTLFRIRIGNWIRVLKMPKNCQIVQFKKNSKIAIYLSLGLHEGRPSCRRSIQLSTENIRNSKHEIS